MIGNVRNANVATALANGRLWGDRGLRVGALLGAGQEGSVYSAFAPGDVDSPSYAVKLYTSAGIGKPESEYAMLKAFYSAGYAPKPHGMHTDPEGRYRALIMNRVRGETLDARLASMSDADCDDFAAKFVVMLASLKERGITHGDMHLGNVFVTDDGDIRLIDFGFAYGPGVETRYGPEGGFEGDGSTFLQSVKSKYIDAHWALSGSKRARGSERDGQQLRLVKHNAKRIWLRLTCELRIVT